MDYIMWLFVFGFFFMIGLGEVFINNMGIVIKMLYDLELRVGGGVGEYEMFVVIYVSIVGIMSMIVRLLMGMLMDLFVLSL